MWIEFRASPIHGTGGFARVAIPAGTRVIPYLGRKISKEESLRQCQSNNRFLFYFDDEFDLDGDVDWNPARLLNHSCDPNCEARRVDEGIVMVAKRDIQAGEEVTFDYGYDLVDYREHPCRCGAPNCVGYILAEEFRSAVSPWRSAEEGG